MVIQLYWEVCCIRQKRGLELELLAWIGIGEWSKICIFLLFQIWSLLQSLKQSIWSCFVSLHDIHVYVVLSGIILLGEHGNLLYTEDNQDWINFSINLFVLITDYFILYFCCLCSWICPISRSSIWRCLVNNFNTINVKTPALPLEYVHVWSLYIIIEIWIGYCRMMLEVQ